MRGLGNLVYPRESLYPTSERVWRTLPADFRERYLADGWEAQTDLRCNWRTFCRWIDQAGGDELRAARREVIKANRKQLTTCAGASHRTDSAWYEKRARR